MMRGVLLFTISALVLLLSTASLAEVTAGCAAGRRAKEKEVEFKELWRAVGWDFSHVLVETTGA